MAGYGVVALVIISSALQVVKPLGVTLEIKDGRQFEFNQSLKLACNYTLEPGETLNRVQFSKKTKRINMMLQIGVFSPSLSSLVTDFELKELVVLSYEEGLACMKIRKFSMSLEGEYRCSLTVSLVNGSLRTDFDSIHLPPTDPVTSSLSDWSTHSKFQEESKSTVVSDVVMSAVHASTSTSALASSLPSSLSSPPSTSASLPTSSTTGSSTTEASTVPTTPVMISTSRILNKVSDSEMSSLVLTPSPSVLTLMSPSPLFAPSSPYLMQSATSLPSPMPFVSSSLSSSSSSSLSMTHANVLTLLSPLLSQTVLSTSSSLQTPLTSSSSTSSFKPASFTSSSSSSSSSFTSATLSSTSSQATRVIRLTESEYDKISKPPTPVAKATEHVSPSILIFASTIESCMSTLKRGSHSLLSANLQINTVSANEHSQMSTKKTWHAKSSLLMLTSNDPIDTTITRCASLQPGGPSADTVEMLSSNVQFLFSTDNSPHDTETPFPLSVNDLLSSSSSKTLVDGFLSLTSVEVSSSLKIASGTMSKYSHSLPRASPVYPTKIPPLIMSSSFTPAPSSVVVYPITASFQELSVGNSRYYVDLQPSSNSEQISEYILSRTSTLPLAIHGSDSRYVLSDLGIPISNLETGSSDVGPETPLEPSLSTEKTFPSATDSLYSISTIETDRHFVSKTTQSSSHAASTTSTPSTTSTSSTLDTMFNYISESIAVQATDMSTYSIPVKYTAEIKSTGENKVSTVFGSPMSSDMEIQKSSVYVTYQQSSYRTTSLSSRTQLIESAMISETLETGRGLSSSSSSWSSAASSLPPSSILSSSSLPPSSILSSSSLPPSSILSSSSLPPSSILSSSSSSSSSSLLSSSLPPSLSLPSTVSSMSSVLPFHSSSSPPSSIFTSVASSLPSTLSSMSSSVVSLNSSSPSSSSPLLSSTLSSILSSMTSSLPSVLSSMSSTVAPIPSSSVSLYSSSSSSSSSSPPSSSPLSLDATTLITSTLPDLSSTSTRQTVSVYPTPSDRTYTDIEYPRISFNTPGPDLDIGTLSSPSSDWILVPSSTNRIIALSSLLVSFSPDPLWLMSSSDVVLSSSSETSSSSTPFLSTTSSSMLTPSSSTSSLFSKPSLLEHHSVHVSVVTPTSFSTSSLTTPPTTRNPRPPVTQKPPRHVTTTQVTNPDVPPEPWMKWVLVGVGCLVLGGVVIVGVVLYYRRKNKTEDFYDYFGITKMSSSLEPSLD